MKSTANAQRHGANPPREEWKVLPQKSPAQQKQTFGYFEDLVRT